jgi:hypothetical protein
MLLGARAGVVGPGTRLREQPEIGITLEELDDPSTRLGVELLKGDLANDLVPGVPPGIHVAGPEET